MSNNRYRLLIVGVVVATIGGILIGPVRPARGETIAATDVEIVLAIESVSPFATLSFSGSGTADASPIVPAVDGSFRRVRVAGETITDGSSVSMSVGQKLELDAQPRVRSNSLSAGESALFRIDLAGTLDVVNQNAFDVTVTVFLEREFFLDARIGDPLTEHARSSAGFHLLVTSHDVLGALVNNFSQDFEDEDIDGEESNPQQKITFDFTVPAEGTANFQLTAYGESYVALVPEPTSACLLGLGGAMTWLGLRRNRRKSHPISLSWTTCLARPS